MGGGEERQHRTEDSPQACREWPQTEGRKEKGGGPRPLYGGATALSRRTL
jgi:hypothetical protein